ncbi:MAG: Holliday junction resolvase RuvX, partial [Woeseiaceae bacterium]|nr:Holliday junction resolvase RuvX [Woeseiaceae bacterium]
MPDSGAPATIIAFDYGLRRIGIAVGQSVTRSASPVGIAANGDDGPDFARIGGLIEEWRPGRLVVGMPTHADGSPTELAPAITLFIEALGRFGLPVDTEDERH